MPSFGSLLSLRGLIACGVVATSIVGCAAEPGEEDGENVAESEDHLLAGRRVSEKETAQLLRAAGFPENMIGKMVCTAKWESSFYERASNKNTNGSGDYGLFQVNSIHFGRAGCPSSSAGLYVASTNAKCAYQIWKSQGINAWYGYKKHKTECDNYRAPAGGAIPTNPAGGGADDDDDTDTSAGGCWSGTLQDTVPANTCVQSKFDSVWFQCQNGKWYRGVSGNTGPYGACASKHALP